MRPALMYFPAIHAEFEFPVAAVPADMPRDVRLQIVSSCAEPPAGDGWLHEIKHDGHRLVAIVAGDLLKLISRNGHDRTALFREPFRPLAEVGFPPMVLDGEIAVPDERGVTHIDALNEAISARRPDQLAYFAFDLLHLDGHDLRRCPIEDCKSILRDVIGAARCPRIVCVDYLLGIGRELFEAVRQVGAEGIVSKRRAASTAPREPGLAEDEMLRDRFVRDNRVQRAWRGQAGGDLRRRGARRATMPRWAGALRLRR